MRKLIPYAGFDPSEEDYSDIVISPLTHRNQLNFGPRKVMDTKTARELRASGMKWDDIGRELAAREGRSAPYQGTSVIQAIMKGR
jgi:hypothetical protein